MAITRSNLTPVETYTEYCPNATCQGFQVPVDIPCSAEALDKYLSCVYRDGHDYPVCAICEDTLLGSGDYFRTMAEADEHEGRDTH